MQKAAVILSVLTGIFAVRAAEARSVYLNGFDISEIRDQKFEKVNVFIDKDGNVRIEGSQYDVKVVPPAENTLNDRGGPNPSLSKKYYLVTQPPKSAAKVQYDFTIKVNGIDKRLVASDGPQVILEISKWLKKGENEIVITAEKNLAGGRKSFSASDTSALLIGTGHEESKIVKIDMIKADVRVNGGTLETVEKRFVIIAE